MNEASREQEEAPLPNKRISCLGPVVWLLLYFFCLMISTYLCVTKHEKDGQSLDLKSH